MNPTLLTRNDDLRHPPANGGKGRDSLFFTLILPEEDLWVFLYTFVDGDGIAGRLSVVMDGEGKPTHYSAVGKIPMRDADMDDWEIDGLTLRHPDPLTTAEIRYAKDDVEVAYDFTGSHEAFDYARNPIGCPQWMAVNRLEQTGRATGELKVGSRKIAFEDVAIHRDHSWGPRDWRMPQHWKWLAAYTDSGKGLNVFNWIAKGETGCNGYVLRDGHAVGILEARTEAEFDDDMTNRRLRATIVDETGATTELEMERFAHIPLPVGSGVVLNEAGCKVTIDGEAGAGQWESHWWQQYVEHLAA